MIIEIVEKLSLLITGAFAFVSALAWNSAIQRFFESRPLLLKQSSWVYAVFITIISVIVTIFVGKISGRLKRRK